MATTNKMTNVKRVLTGAKLIRITPYVDGILSTTDHYELDEIVEDTTSVTKEEGDSTSILNEKGGSITTTYTQGLRQFAADLGDLQDAGLEGLFGWVKSKEGRLYEPSSMPELFCQIEIVFLGGAAKLTMPKVQMNSSVTFESLKSDIGRGKLAGTAQNVKETITLPDDETAEVEYSCYLEKVSA